MVDIVSLGIGLGIGIVVGILIGFFVFGNKAKKGLEMPAAQPHAPPIQQGPQYTPGPLPHPQPMPGPQPYPQYQPGPQPQTLPPVIQPQGIGDQVAHGAPGPVMTGPAGPAQPTNTVPAQAQPVTQPAAQQNVDQGTTVQVQTAETQTQVAPQPGTQPATQAVQPPVEAHTELEDRFHKGKKCRLCGAPLEEGETCKSCQAKVALSMAENSVAELKAEGAKIYVDAKVKDAKTAIDNGDFESAGKIAREIQDQTKEMGQKFSEAKRQLDAANSTLAEVEKAGVDVSQARTTLTLATSFFEDGEYDKCLRYGVKAERLAKDLADKAKVTMKKAPEAVNKTEPSPTAASQPATQTTSPTQGAHTTQPEPGPTSMKATLCNICRGVIKPGLPIIKCSCGRQFHEACASRVGDCPSCGRKI